MCEQQNGFNNSQPFIEATPAFPSPLFWSPAVFVVRLMQELRLGCCHALRLPFQATIATAPVPIDAAQINQMPSPCIESTLLSSLAYSWSVESSRSGSEFVRCAKRSDSMNRSSCKPCQGSRTSCVSLQRINLWMEPTYE
jgi:hypothetical protein